MSEHENVVLITYDSLRADHCGFMGYERATTPALDHMGVNRKPMRLCQFLGKLWTSDRGVDSIGGALMRFQHE